MSSSSPRADANGYGDLGDGRSPLLARPEGGIDVGCSSSGVTALTTFSLAKPLY